MSPSESTSRAAPARPARADARRNREKLLVTARAAFAAADGAVALEAIARDAGVGIGTLYRHFPTREALVEAVYAAELDDVTASAHALLTELPPDAALRTWMDRYTAFVASKRGMLATLRAGGSSGMATPTLWERITGAIAAIVDAGARTGAFRAGIDPEDVATLLLGIFHGTQAAGDPERIGRLLDLIVDSLRPKAPPAG